METKAAAASQEKMKGATVAVLVQNRSRDVAMAQKMANTNGCCSKERRRVRNMSRAHKLRVGEIFAISVRGERFLEMLRTLKCACDTFENKTFGGQNTKIEEQWQPVCQEAALESEMQSHRAFCQNFDEFRSCSRIENDCALTDHFQMCDVILRSCRPVVDAAPEFALVVGRDGVDAQQRRMCQHLQVEAVIGATKDNRITC